MATFVAVAHFELSMPWVGSLKEKRAVVVPIVEGLRRRYPLVVARVAGQDAHRWERLALVSVGTDPNALRGTVEAAERFVVASGVELRWRSLDVEAWGDEPAAHER